MGGGEGGVVRGDGRGGGGGSRRGEGRGGGGTAPNETETAIYAFNPESGAT